MGAGEKAIELAVRAATSAPAEKAANKGAEKALLAAGAAAGALGTKRLKARGEKRRARETAIRLARQVGGQYSERTIVDGEERCVVWKDGAPIDVFPRLNAKTTPEMLAERPELKDFSADLLVTPGPDV